MAMDGSWTFVHAASQHSPPPTASYIHLLCAKAALYDSFRPGNNTHLCRYSMAFKTYYLGENVHVMTREVCYFALITFSRIDCSK